MVIQGEKKDKERTLDGQKKNGGFMEEFDQYVMYHDIVKKKNTAEHDTNTGQTSAGIHNDVKTWFIFVFCDWNSMIPYLCVLVFMNKN